MSGKFKFKKIKKGRAVKGLRPTDWTGEEGSYQPRHGVHTLTILQGFSGWGGESPPSAWSPPPSEPIRPPSDPIHSPPSRVVSPHFMKIFLCASRAFHIFLIHFQNKLIASDSDVYFYLF